MWECGTVLFYVEFGNNRIVINKWLDERNKVFKNWICDKEELKIFFKLDYMWWVLEVKVLGKIKFGN